MPTPDDAMAHLLALVRALDPELPLEEALKQVTDATLGLTGGEHASIRILDDRDTELLQGARSGAGATSRPVTLGRGLGVVGWVVEHATATRVDDAREDPRFVRFTGQGFDIRSMAAVPLLAAGKVVGVLSTTSPEANTFDDDDVTLLRVVATVTAPAIERSRRHRQELTDRRTRAFNAKYLLPKLEEERARADPETAPLSVLVADLDALDRVNAQHGTKVGHAVLRVFADRVRGLVRQRDALVRRGEDDFVVIMPETTLTKAKEAAERIRREMAEAPVIVKHGPRIAQTVSAGVATWDGSETAERLLARADAALKEAKGRGPDSVSVSDLLYDTT